jgi:hypothetical protein
VQCNHWHFICAALLTSTQASNFHTNITITTSIKLQRSAALYTRVSWPKPED